MASSAAKDALAAADLTCSIRSAETGAVPLITIQPAERLSFGFAELWRYRELFYFLAWRDVKVRYKQTALGAAWALLQPLLTMVIFSLFFGRLARIPSDGLPYPLFALCALVPWQLFAYTLTEAGNSLVNSQHLIKKVYFPRLVIPVSATLSGVIDFGVAFVLLLAMMAWYGVKPQVAVLLLPLFFLFTLLTALAVGIWIACLNAEYRDFRHVLPFLTQLWLFATPIAYPASLIPARWRFVVGLNPMAGVVEGFRWSLLGARNHAGPLMLVSSSTVLIVLISGIVYFRHKESTFADVV